MHDMPMIGLADFRYIQAYPKKLRGVQVRLPSFDYDCNAWLAR